MKTLEIVVTWESRINVEVEDDFEYVPNDSFLIEDEIFGATEVEDLALIQWEVMGEE